MVDSILLKISLVTVLASVMVVVPISVGITTVKKWKDNPSLKSIFIYCLIYAMIEIIGWYYALHHWQNHFLTNTVAYLDIVFWGYYFYILIINPLQKRAILVSVTLTILLMVWSNWTNIKSYNFIDSFTHSISNIVIIAMALLFFYQLLNNLNIRNLFQYSDFWIVAGILLYFSGVSFVHIFADYITFNKDESIIQFWDIEDFLLFFQRIFLAIGLWFSKTPPQLSPSSK
jgi:hypothetical protein